MLRAPQHESRDLGRDIAVVAIVGCPLTRPPCPHDRQPPAELGFGRSSCPSTTLIAVAGPDDATKTARQLRLILRHFRRTGISLPRDAQSREDILVNYRCEGLTA